MYYFPSWIIIRELEMHYIFKDQIGCFPVHFIIKFYFVLTRIKTANWGKVTAMFNK